MSLVMPFVYVCIYIYKAAMKNVLHGEERLKETKFNIARTRKDSFQAICPAFLVAECLELSERTAVYKAKIRSDQQQAKLHRLFTDSPWGRASLLDCVTNLSSHTLSPAQHQVLGFGLAFALPLSSCPQPPPELCQRHRE